MWYHWCCCQGHIKPTVSSMAPFHLLGGTWLFGHLMPLVLVSVSHDVNSIINGTITFNRLSQLKWEAAWLLVTWCHWYHIGIRWCHWYHHYHQMMPLALMLASCDDIPLVSGLCDADSIINGTQEFLRPRWWKWGATCHFGHVTPLLPACASYDTKSIVNSTIALLRSRHLKMHNIPF